MEKQLLHHIKHVKSAMNRAHKLDKSKIKDMLAFQISITYIDNAMNKGLLSQADFIKLIKGVRKK